MRTPGANGRKASMSDSKLPERASLEYLKKLAKDYLAELRRTDPKAKLADAQLAIARNHGFANWRALKTEVDKRQKSSVDRYFEACGRGDATGVRRLIARDASLIRAAAPRARYAGWTGLHEAAKHGHGGVVRVLLDAGADVNSREAGDNTYPLHWAAAHRHLYIVRALVDAGGDVHGAGDDHQLDVIGWATYFHDTGQQPGDKPEVARFLLERGARHHIFSAIALGDSDAVREVVARDPTALERRMSRFEGEQTALHLAAKLGRDEILDILLESGVSLEATDMNGLSAMESALLRGDRATIARLAAAGAKQPEIAARTEISTRMSDLGKSVKRIAPMIFVPDVAAALDWYRSIGFEEVSRYSDGALVNFGIVRFGVAQILINMNGRAGEHDAALWIYTDKVDEIYRLLKSKQIDAVRTGGPGIDFVEHINDTFYGAREFGIRDLNGYALYFIR